MQYHSGAIMLALYNYFRDSSKKKFEVRLKSPKSNYYTVLINSDSGSKLSLTIHASIKIWKCYCDAYVSDRSQRMQRITIKHSEQDGDRVTDEFKMNDYQVRDGYYTPMRGSKRSFSGYFSGSTQLTISTINRNNESVSCDYELC